MRTLILISIVFLFCSSCEKDKNTFPTKFNITINIVEFETATISWDEIEFNDEVLFDVILNDTLVASEISIQNYTFKDLEANRLYNGKVVAKNTDGNRAVGEFRFSTNDIGLSVEIDKFIFDLDDANKIIASIKWKVNSQVNPPINYSVHLNGVKIIDDFNGNLLTLNQKLNQKASYKITVVASFSSSSIIKEIEFTTPSIENYNLLEFSINPSYIGYTAFNIELRGLNNNLANSYYLNDELISSNKYNSEFLISNLPINYAHNQVANSYKFELYSQLNDSIGSKRMLELKTKTLKRLPDENLYVTIFNVGMTDAQVFAYNNSNVDIYNESYNGATKYKIYKNQNYIGDYKCEYVVGGAVFSFPILNNLYIENENCVKVEVDYNNPLVDTRYEPQIPTTTFKEIKFKTFKTPLPANKEIEITISKTLSNYVEFYWRTDLSSFYVCSPGRLYSKGLQLSVDGKDFQNYEITNNPIKISGLLPKTSYNALLIFNYENVYGEKFQRKLDFSFTTSE